MRTTFLLLVLAAVEITGCFRVEEVGEREEAVERAEDVDDPLREGAEARVYRPEAEPVVPVDEVVLPPPSARDQDRDGFTADLDRDDADPFTYPGAVEQPCDGIDQSGDGLDECPLDVDGDGAPETLDCDDLDPEIGPRAREVLCNGRDENCNGRDDCDRDGDRALDHDDLDADDPAVGYRESDVAEFED